MAELDTCGIKNPSTEDFSARFNGELYMVRAGETKTYPKYLAYHLAKHLSNRLMDKEMRVLDEKYAKDTPYVPQISTLMNHDNPTRRKYLYDILGSKAEVELCLVQIGLKSFVGEMREYDQYVATLETPKEIPEEETAPTTEPEAAPAVKVPKAKKAE